MKRKVYIETSVVSYLTSRVSRDLVVAARQQVTGELWPRLLRDYVIVISLPVLDEVSKGDSEAVGKRLEAIRKIPVLEVDAQVKVLARTLVEARAIPPEYPEDALHVAVAAINGCDFLLTWNFTHLNNAFTRARIRRVIEQQGFESPEICSPDEMFGESP